VPGGFPDDVYLGTLLEVTTTGWRRWFDARGPVDLTGRAVALDASAAALAHLSELPTELRGLSLAGLPVSDDDVAVIVRRLRLLTWLDLRGTGISVEALGSLRRLRRLRHLGLDQSVLVTARARSGAGIGGKGLRSAVTVRTEGAELVPSHSGLPDPDTAGFNALLTAAVAENPGLGGVDPDEATARAAVLLDAGRPEQALAVLAPMIVTGDPGLLLVAARSANEIGTAAQALAPLALGPPTGDLLAWRAIFLSRTAPAQAVVVARAAMHESPADLAALWAICSAYLNAGQFALAERTVAELEAQRPGWPDTAKLAARLARGRRRYRDEIAAWHRVLAEQPDDADALAGLARAQRSARPLSMTWMTTLNSAATADVDRHGASFLEQVTRHRRQLARLVGVVVTVVSFLVGTAAPWAGTRRAGLVLAAGLTAAYLTAGLLWVLTPGPVRQVIRRTDDLTGMRRGPNWRRPLVGGLMAAVALAVPIDLPRSDNCDGKYQQACSEPIVAPTIRLPQISIPTFSPLSIPTFDVPTLPSFSPVPVTELPDPEPSG
jgi:tetratricopeptide repeat protein